MALNIPKNSEKKEHVKSNTFNLLVSKNKKEIKYDTNMIFRCAKEEKALFTKYCEDRGYNMTNLFRQFMNSKIAEIPQEERDAFLEQNNEWKNN